MKEIKCCFNTYRSIIVDSSFINNGTALIFNIKNRDFIGTLHIALDTDDPEFVEDDFDANCDKILVSLSTELDLSHAELLEKAHTYIIRYLTYFIDYIQVYLGQYWFDLGHIRHWSLTTFLSNSNAKWVEGNREIDIGIPLGVNFKDKRISISPKKREYSEIFNRLDDKNIGELKNWVEEKRKSDLSSRLISESKRFFSQGDYRLSSILAITALERPLEDFVEERCKAHGILQFDTYNKSHFIADYLKILFPLVLKQNEINDWLAIRLKSSRWYWNKVRGEELITWAIELNQARNDAIHKGGTPQFDIVDKGIFAVEVICEFIKSGK